MRAQSPLTGTVKVNGIDTADLRLRPRLRNRSATCRSCPNASFLRKPSMRTLRLARVIWVWTRTRFVNAWQARSRNPVLSLQRHCSADRPSRSPVASNAASPWPGSFRCASPSWCLTSPWRASTPAAASTFAPCSQDLKKQGTALLVVTHSMDDVAELADHVVILDHGRVAADGTPREVSHHPRRRPGEHRHPKRASVRRTSCQHGTSPCRRKHPAHHR